MLSLVEDGFQILKELWICRFWLNISTCGTFFPILNYRLGWTTHIFGDSQLLGYTPPNQPMRPYSLEPLSLVHGKEFGRVGLQGNASSSCGLWPIIDVGQQIDFAKRGLNHPPKCPLCDQVGESIDHLLVSCVFTRQFWFCILQQFGLQAVAPRLDEHCFIDWWARASSRFSGQVKEGVDSIIILGSWLVWKHRNYCVFDGGTPSLSRVMTTFREDVQQWSVAGARGASYLLALPPTS